MDNKMVETVAKIRTALCLFNSMIKGGEQHSQTSMGAFHEAMNALEAIAAQTPQWSDAIPDSPGDWWHKFTSMTTPPTMTKIKIDEDGPYIDQYSTSTGATKRHVKTWGGQWAKATPPESKGE